MNTVIFISTMALLAADSAIVYTGNTLPLVSITYPNESTLLPGSKVEREPCHISLIHMDEAGNITIECNKEVPEEEVKKDEQLLPKDM